MKRTSNVTVDVVSTAVCCTSQVYGGKQVTFDYLGILALQDPLLLSGPFPRALVFAALFTMFTPRVPNAW
jgi:hypothetical protein